MTRRRSRSEAVRRRARCNGASRGGCRQAGAREAVGSDRHDTDPGTRCVKGHLQSGLGRDSGGGAAGVAAQPVHHGTVGAGVSLVGFDRRPRPATSGPNRARLPYGTVSEHRDAKSFRPSERIRTTVRNERLSDVMALIQVLALDKHAHRSESGLTGELQMRPRSAPTWTEVAQGHPEFFRVHTGRDHPISLVARHVLPRQPKGGAAHFSAEFVAGLLRAAIDIHDRQVRRCERWTYLIPIWVALIGAVAVLAAALLRALAIERVLQCVAPAGIVSKVCTTTRSTSSSPIVRGAPGRGSSSKPSQPSRRKRRRHLPTVPRVVPSSPATSRPLLPAAVSQHDPRPQDQRLSSLGPSHPALQLLPLSLRQIWNLSRVVVRHSRSPPQGRPTMAPSTSTGQAF